MGVSVLVLGQSGSGKSTSLRAFEPGEVGILNVAGKPLPFRKRLPKADHVSYENIMAALSKNEFNAYVIDDANYLMAFDNFSKAETKGYEKFVKMAVSFERVLEAANRTDANTVVYFLMHPDRDSMGQMKPKTIGKMLDEKLCVEGLFPVVIESAIEIDGNDSCTYVFRTTGRPDTCIKAPMEMLPEVMDNDLRAVDTAIRDYWGLEPLAKQPEKKRKAVTEDADIA